MHNRHRFILAGVMGWPMMHSRSPIIHNHSFAQYGIEGTYVPLAIRPEGCSRRCARWCRSDLPAAISPFRTRRRRSRSSTTSTRRRAHRRHQLRRRRETAHLDRTQLRRLSASSPRCTRRRPTGAPSGGASSSARAAARAPSSRPVDAARARFACSTARSRARRRLPPISGRRVGADRWEERHVRARRRGTSGQRHQPGDDRPAAARSLAGDLPSSALVADIVYAPLETPLLAAARSIGATPVDGLGMLLHQARPAFCDWTGVMPEVTPAMRDLIAATL